MRARSRLLVIVFVMAASAVAMLVAIAAHRQLPAALTGFAARTVCGGVFIGGRVPDEVIRDDLQSISVAMRLIDISLDTGSRRVSASLPIAGTRHALYQADTGCTLLPPGEVPEVAVLSRRDIAGDGNDLSGAAGVLRSERLQPTSIPWPLGAGALAESDWPAGVNAASLHAAVAHAFATSAASSVRPGVDTGKGKGARAVLVAHDAKLLLERYAGDFDARTPQLGWSLAKTVFSALAWSRFQSMATDLRTPVVELLQRVPRPSWVGEWQRDNRRAISLDHLFTMYDGLDHPADDNLLLTELPQLLWVSHDAGRFAGERQAATPPGQKWRYASPVSNLLSRVLRDQFASDEDYLSYADETLFEPIGALSATFEADGAGNVLGSSYLWASPHDWLRLGWLLLQDGRWNDQVLFPPGWLEYASAQRVDADGRPSPYGAHAWLTGPGNALGCDEKHSLPPNGLVATGVWGQILGIFPQQRTVILRLGWTAPVSADKPCEFLSSILEALP